MTTVYRYSFDKRLVVFWGVFGVRPAKDGVTLTDDDRLRATFGLFKLETPLRTSTAPTSPGTTAGGRRPAPGLDEGRRAHVRNERERRRVHPLPREGAVAAQALWPLRADGHRRGSRGVDGGARAPVTSPYAPQELDGPAETGLGRDAPGVRTRTGRTRRRPEPAYRSGPCFNSHATRRRWWSLPSTRTRPTPSAWRPRSTRGARRTCRPWLRSARRARPRPAGFRPLPKRLEHQLWLSTCARGAGLRPC